MINEYIKLKFTALAIPKLIEELSKENQEEIIKITKDYFSLISDGNYEDLVIEENILIGIRKKVLSKLGNDNIISYDIIEEEIKIAYTQMSEGTKDQLFLSLRLAFITLFNQKTSKKLPFLADDIFINFDENRIKCGLKLLKEFSKTTQVIFFTHSKRVEELSNTLH